MNEENQTTVPAADETTADTDTTTPETTTDIEDSSSQVTDPGEMPLGVTVTSPIDFRETTVVRTDKGDIHVIHEITLGEVIISTLIMALLIFRVLDRVIRR